MGIHERIYHIMEDGMMNQASVARAAGYTPKVFNDMVRKRKLIRPEDITPICKALKVTPNVLFGWDSHNSSEEAAQQGSPRAS